MDKGKGAARSRPKPLLTYLRRALHRAGFEEQAEATSDFLPQEPLLAQARLQGMLLHGWRGATCHGLPQMSVDGEAL